MLPLLCACLPVLAPAEPLLTTVPYSLGDWPEQGRGNHRALVRVEAPAPAVRVHLEWRRRDPQPERKAILVFDAATGQPVRNVLAVQVTRECGDLVFQPATAPGTYEVYYLPYNPGTTNFDDPGTYFPAAKTADPAWVAAHHLAGGDAWRRLPAAALLQIQARGEFHRMDPMEVIATAAETQQLQAAHPQPYLVFPEDRRYPVKMIDDLPQKWILSGPSDRFRGSVRPGEYYVFQLGVYAARQAVGQVVLDCGELRGEGGAVIGADAFECVNLSGRDWLGRPVQPQFTVGAGKVRALWVGLRVPAEARGRYQGTVTVKPVGLPATPVALDLEVTGAVLTDHGDSDLWRLARLRWLNSTLGLEDEVVPPFTPVAATDDEVAVLGRRVRFGADGLPASIVSFGQEVLAQPVRLVVETADGPMGLTGDSRVVERRQSLVDRETRGSGGGLAVTTTSRTEFDGTVKLESVFTAQRDTELRDLRLEVPIRREVATYLMGLSHRGGLRPQEWSWKWSLERSDNAVWIGEVDAGLQLKLLEDRDVWHWDLHDTGLPVGWSNGGRGGAQLTEQGDTVLLKAYCGPRRLRAGETLTLRYRFLITPLKPVDPIHWNQRYGPGYAGGNIEHVHHGCAQNPYINYPFIEAAALKRYVEQVRGQGGLRRVGRLDYPAAGQINSARGTVHIWARVLFDPSLKVNRNLFELAWPNEDCVGFYWNLDDVGMRVYIRHGAPQHNRYRLVMGGHSPGWKQGELHRLTFSWGDGVRIFVDGRKVAERANLPGLLDTPLDGARLTLTGPWGLEGIKISDRPYAEGAPVQPQADAGCLLMDNFAKVVPPGVTVPARGGGGRITGDYGLFTPPEGLELRFGGQPQRMGVNVYYTVRELTNHVVEMWPLRSLGDEVFTTGRTLLYTDQGATLNSAGGGYPWLQEHLVNGYTPAWRQPLPNGDHCAAIGTQGLSRWHNYYVEGLAWLMRNTGVDGLYLDGIGYDREIMKRVARVMHRVNPDSRINFHCGNDYDYLEHKVSPLNEYLEHLPYLTTLWIGEMYDYNRSPDYWLVEISGLPFGLASEMLNYENGGNAYRGMLYGMSGRQHASAPAMWAWWDEWGIEKAEMLGYWRRDCPVRTGRDDVLATVYRQRGKAVIALASWASQAVDVRLKVDWAALGLDPAKVRLRATAIARFQDAARFDPTGSIRVEPGRGWLIEAE